MLKKPSRSITQILFLPCVLTAVVLSLNAQYKNFRSNDQSPVAPFIQKTKLTASDTAPLDSFGRGVAVQGDTAVVGAAEKNGGRGAVYIYVRSGNTWTEQQKLTASDGAATNYFGNSVAISGNTVIIGAYGRNTGTGAAYIFVRSGNAWSEQQKLTASDAATLALFGWSVDISGDTAIVGAKDANSFRGAAYVFVRSGSVWTEQQKLSFPSGSNIERFGESVGISGETAAVGATGDFTTGILRRGAAYVFTRSGSVWTEQQKLLASDGQDSDYMGNSIAIEKDTVVVGSQAGTSVPASVKGAAYVFARSGTMWSEQQKLTASDGANGDKFGINLAISGDKVIVGSMNDINSDNNREGAAYIFELAEGVWNEEQKIHLAPEVQSPAFGRSVAIDGDTILVGAPGQNGNLGSAQGAAYIFAPQVGNKSFDFDGDGRADVSVYRPSEGIWYINGSQNGFFGVQFGISTDQIAPADFDGDGKTDFAVYRDGIWYILNSADNSVRILQFGLAGDIPIPADYDGDGKADINIYRPSNQVWYRLNSTDGQFFFKLFGSSGDQPFIANFDGDNKADIALYRSSNSTFYWINSTTGADAAVQFGNPGDISTAADFDGDGKTDLAVFRPSDGVWYRRNSSNGAAVSTYFGLTGDIPAAGDYDGDNLTDLAVFRPSNGFWYILGTTNGFYGYNFGIATDQPVPAAY